MRGTQVVIAAAARFFTPLFALFALVLLATRAPGNGAGFVAGLAFGLVLLLHALTFGADAARAAFPMLVARLCVALGLMAVCVGAGAPGFVYSGQMIEAGAFALTLGGVAFVVQTLFGRAPTLRDAEL
ncbi:MAG: MnhB domain-containing protein [Hyphomonadaceae bacterium]